MMQEENKESPSQISKVQATHAWQDYVVTKADDVKEGLLILFRDPDRRKLISVNVEKVLRDLKRIVFAHITNHDDSKEPERFALDYRCFVELRQELMGVECFPHTQAMSIPKSLAQDVHNLSYHLCLLRLNISTELCYEAARIIPALNLNEDGKVKLYCVFEIISGKVHMVKKNRIFTSDATLVTQRTRFKHEIRW